MKLKQENRYILLILSILLLLTALVIPKKVFAFKDGFYAAADRPGKTAKDGGPYNYGLKGKLVKHSDRVVNGQTSHRFDPYDAEIGDLIDIYQYKAHDGSGIRYETVNFICLEPDVFFRGIADFPGNVSTGTATRYEVTGRYTENPKLIAMVSWAEQTLPNNRMKGAYIQAMTYRVLGTMSYTDAAVNKYYDQFEKAYTQNPNDEVFKTATLYKTKNSHVNNIGEVRHDWGQLGIVYDVREIVKIEPVVSINKTSTNVSLLATANYSLEGAEFGLYKSVADARADRNRVATFRTNANGASNAVKLPEQALYYAMETKAPKGHKKSNHYWTMDLRNKSSLTGYTIPNEAHWEKGTVKLGLKTDPNSKPLKGAIFEIKYHDNVQSGVRKTWYVETSRNGEILLRDSSLTSFNGIASDSLYKEGASPILPIGHYKVKEVQSPYGFLPTDYEYTFDVTLNGEQINHNINSDRKIINKPTHTKITKQSSYAGMVIPEYDNSNHRMAFKLYEDGRDVTSKLVINSDTGNYRFNDSNNNGLSEIIIPKDNEMIIEALKIGPTYTLEEVRPPLGFELPKDPKTTFEVTAQNGEDDPKLVTMGNTPTSLRVNKKRMQTEELVENNPMTFKVYQESGTINGDITKHLKQVSSDNHINEQHYVFDLNHNGNEVIRNNNQGTIIIKGLEWGSKYYFEEVAPPKGYFPDEAPYRDKNERKLTLNKQVGSPDNIMNTENVMDIINEEIPTISTSLNHGESKQGLDGNLKEVYPTSTIPFEDTIYLGKILMDWEYEATYTLTDYDTGDVIASKTETFRTGNERDHEHKITINLDGRNLRGKRIVARETIKRLDSALPDKTKAIHDDLSDLDQTLRVVDPSIRTKFTNFEGNKLVQAQFKQDLIDTVTYHDFVIGLDVNLHLDIWDNTFDLPLDFSESSANVTFNPQTKSGDTEIPITTNLHMHKGKDLVALTEMYYEDELMTDHSDKRDKDQTIRVVAPAMPITGSNRLNNNLALAIIPISLTALIGLVFYLRKRKELK